eukprot:TRINITY_DN23314_c0_g1_i1.p1 TRINITY_DN23314_c0_g1~~TRINITY_DN23314_c0_g1_i1.p1  ORF type:complete len:944 (+),score=109.87 TRINITY_DN23314_c0_g1_i1:104-2935(+)
MEHEKSLLQLHRTQFTERLRLESRLQLVCKNLMLFMLMFVLYCATLYLYDPLSEISRIHKVLRHRYNLEAAESAGTPREIMGYLQYFIDASVELSSALVDANTLNSTDIARCFSDDVSDVCRSKYWYVPQVSTEQDYVNMSAILTDSISPKNSQPSTMDCSSKKPRPNCIDRNSSQFVDHSIPRKVFGLLPEDPIIMKNRLDYPFQSVVPLTPVVWQTLGKKVPCQGFGETYNSKILGAGKCSAASKCHPDEVTSFFSSNRNPFTSRLQTIFLTYDSPAFSCIDRTEQATEFRDKSWEPWATYEDMAQGKLLKSTLKHGKHLFYKFVTDVAYLQAPIPGDLCINNVSHGGCDSSENGVCVDPITLREHPLWSDSVLKSNYDDVCSLRKKWSDQYLAKQPDARSNTWFTVLTSSLTVAALVITPQPAGVSDVVTLVEANFEIDQYGSIQGKSKLTSTSETLSTFYIIASFCLVSCVLSLVDDLWWIYRHIVKSSAKMELNERGLLSNEAWVKRPEFQVFFSLLCTILVAGQVTALLVIDLSPPHEFRDLEAAFVANDPDVYFETFHTIRDYNATLSNLKHAGFFVVVTLFMRLCIFMSLHPRLGVLADTMIVVFDDTCHFLIYFLLISVLFAFLGSWAFAAQDSQFESIEQTFWTQFRMFTGVDIPLPRAVLNSQAAFAVYLVVYVLVVFITLLNFLLAIVVNGYTSVQAALETNLSEQNALYDFSDALVALLLRRKPSSLRMLAYLAAVEPSLANTSENSRPAITAEELYTRVEGVDGAKVFETLEAARSYVKYYAYKVRNAGVYSLLEDRSSCLMPPGRYWGDDVDGADTRFDDCSQRRGTSLADQQKHFTYGRTKHKKDPMHCKLHDLMSAVKDIHLKLEQAAASAEDPNQDGQASPTDLIANAAGNDAPVDEHVQNAGAPPSLQRTDDEQASCSTVTNSL